MELAEIWRLFQQGGPLTYLIGLVGGVGLAFSLGVLGILVSGGRTAARTLATLALLCSAIAVSVGVAGESLARARVDSALGGRLPPSAKERMQRVGYVEARGCATLGLLAALIPTVVGALGLLLGRPRRVQASGRTVPEMQAANPVVGKMGAVLLLITGGVGAYATTLRKGPLPGRDLDEAGWSLLSLHDSLLGGKVDAACVQGAALGVPADVRLISSELEELQRGCADKLIAELDAAPDSLPTQHRLEELSHARWLLPGEARSRVEARLAAAKGQPTPAPAPPAQADAGEPPPAAPARPSLPPAVLRSAVARRAVAIKRCYQTAVKKRPRLTGELRVEFVVAASGKVKSARDAGGNVADPRLRSCVVGEVKKLRFPADKERGEVTLNYPFVFKPSNPGSQ